MTSYHFRAAEGGSSNAPLIFLFHGTGGDENQFFDLAAELVPGAARIAPRGDVSEGGALRYFRRTAEGVYDMEDLAQRTAAMADFVRAEVSRRQPEKVLGLGYSNGANILASVMFAAPDLFDAAVLMHPLIPFTPPPVDFSGRRVLVTAGQYDPIAPATGSQALLDYFKANGAAAEIVWHPGGHEVRREELLGAQRFLGA